MNVHDFVDEDLVHSSYVIDLGDGTAAVADPPSLPGTWSTATGTPLLTGR